MQTIIILLHRMKCKGLGMLLSLKKLLKSGSSSIAKVCKESQEERCRGDADSIDSNFHLFP